MPNESPEGQGVASRKVQYSHDLLADESLVWIDHHVRDNSEHPFFLCLTFTLPHANNEAGNDGLEVPDSGAYEDLDWPLAQRRHAAMISRLDRDLGRFVARLKQHGLDQRTLVIFTSDNGPHAEGGKDPDFNDSNGPLRGIKRSLNDGGIRVPLIVRWPGNIKPGAVSGLVYGSQDLLPTLAEFAGARAVAATPRDIDGLSLAPTLLGKDEQKKHDYLYWAFYEHGAARAIRSGRWKGVEQPLGTPLRLYDLSDDLGESHDFAMRTPDVVSRLERWMDEAHRPSARWTLPRPVYR